MPRSVKPWIGRDDNHRAPKKVRDRIFEREQHRCHLCEQDIQSGQKWDLDHVIALINGGENSEQNLKPVHRKCHTEKTARDVAEKAKIAAIRQKHRGIVDAPKMQGRGFQTTPKAEARKAKASDKQPLPRRSLYIEESP